MGRPSEPGPRAARPPRLRWGRSFDAYEVSCRARAERVALRLAAMRPGDSGPPLPPLGQDSACPIRLRASEALSSAPRRARRAASVGGEADGVGIAVVDLERARHERGREHTPELRPAGTD